MPLDQSDLEKIEQIVEKRKSSSSSGCTTIILILFILGCFKGCGY